MNKKLGLLLNFGEVLIKDGQFSFAGFASAMNKFVNHLL
jgi:hypothetical protein